ncbi:MAG: ABC transporter ATP-binding protein NatA [Ignavibacteria bacterium]|nr:ABC transporter ATP-binding protein NatA [Ignavibacteria bacterium]
MITVKNLTKIYSPEITALDNISFEIPKGCICGYIGTNGAGKSTTVKILTGILDFDKGDAAINGLDIRKENFEVKKIVGYVPETAMMFNSLTAIEYLQFIGKVRNLSDDSLNRRIQNFAELFEFSEFLSESIGALSKGNKQKVLIASALLHNPEVIFLDEPLNGLDANSIFIFQDLLKYLISADKTILYCSHLLNTVEQVSSKIILLDKGKIVLDTETSLLKQTENYKGLEELFRNLNPEQSTKNFPYESLFV